MVRLFVSLALVSFLGCGASKGEGTTPAERGFTADPERQLAWLPDTSAAVVHIDLDAIRATSWYPSLSEQLPEASRESMARTHELRVAFEQGPDDLWMTVVVRAEPGAPPTEWLAGDEPSTPQVVAGHEVLKNSSFGCFETPEKLWVCTEHALIERLLVPPEQRTTRLPEKGWASAPEGAGYVSVQARVPASVRSAAMNAMSQADDPSMAMVMGPMVRSLSFVSLRVADAAGGISALVEATFDNETGAQGAVGILSMIKVAMLAERDEPLSADARALVEAIDIRVTGSRVTLELRIDAATTKRITEEMVREMRQKGEVAVGPFGV
jgi:hypothetical protein